jgi:protein-S-isoprenylcysteine O-methyltransferase Ste14
VPEDRDNAGVVAPPPLIFAVPLVFSLFLNRRTKLPFLPAGLTRLLGWPLLIGGLLFGGWFVTTFRRADTPVDPYKPVSNLVTDGPYRYTRNPGYLGFAAVYAGVSCLKNSLPSITLLPAVIAVMNRGVIEREERYLEEKFGEEYLRYKHSVRRWV